MKKFAYVFVLTALICAVAVTVSCNSGSGLDFDQLTYEPEATTAEPETAEQPLTQNGLYFKALSGGTYGVRFIHGDSHAFQKFKLFQQQCRGVFCKGLDQQK